MSGLDPEPGADDPPPDLGTVEGYLDALCDALIDGAEVPEPSAGLLASLGPEARAELDARAARIGKLAGREAPAATPRRPGWPAIGGYELLGELGEGGQGKVYLARKVGLFDRRFAVKVLDPPPGAGSTDWRERVGVEVEALCRLDVPGVVRIVDHGESTDKRPYIAMDYVAGASLSRRIRANQPRETRPQPVLAAADLAMRLAEIVREVNGRGIFHRDLKPGNILLPGPESLGSEAVLADLREGEAPVIADFGLAKVFVEPRARPVSHDARWIGTSTYMAPEQWDSSRFGPVGPATDVWALGVILYELLTARLPFPGDAQPVDDHACDGDPIWPRRHRGDIPPDLEAIVLKALKPSSSSRYPTAEAMADDLRRFLAGDPVSARRPGLAQKARAWHRGNRRLVRWAAASLALFAGLSGAVVGLYGVQSGQLAAARANATAARANAGRVHEALVESARALARRGDWPAALDAYRRGVADRRDDATRLRVERLTGYLAVNDLATMRREIDELSPRADLGTLKAPLALARGTLFLCDRRTRERGMDAVREALAARHDLYAISPADPAYAESLLQTAPREVLAKLREAVANDPFHVPARTGLVVALLIEGQLAEARDEAGRLKSALPRADLPDFVLILVDLCEGDRAAADRRLDDLARRLGPSRAADVATLRDYVGHLGNLIDALSRYDPNVFAPLNALALKFESRSLNKVMARGLPFDLPVPTLGPLGDAVEGLASATGPVASLALPVGEPTPALSVGSMFQAIERLVAVMDKNQLLGGDEGFRRLEAASRSCGDALFATLMALNRLPACSRALFRQDFVAFRKLIPEVAAWSHRGANGPTLLPRSPLRYKCLVVESVVDVTAMKFTRDVDPLVPVRLRDNLHRLVADGRRHPRQRREALPMVLSIVTTPLVKAELADWGIEEGIGRDPYRDRCRWLFSYARGLLDDWLADEPGNKAALAWIKTLDEWPEPRG